MSTSEDISTTKYEHGAIRKPESKYRDWGVFGLGYRPGPTSVVSTFRIGHKDQGVFMDRIKKITLHEIGHNIGLLTVSLLFHPIRDFG